MKITTISKVASLAISSVMIQTAVAGHAVGIGVGPHFGGGGIFGMLFGAHPTSERPVIVRSPSRIATSPGRPAIPSGKRGPISSINHQSTADLRPQVASHMQNRKSQSFRRNN